MRRVAAASALLAGALAGCDRTPEHARSPGAALERAAVAAGLITDAASASVIGSWARGTDRICVVPAGRAARIGVAIDYGEGQGCTAAGRAEHRGETLKVEFGACRFTARFDGERISFPADVPIACADLCRGRATLAAVTVDRMSGSASEAATLRGPGGEALCSS